MSHENPGDGLGCDHCGVAAHSERDGRLGFLAPNRGELLCSLCIWIAVDAELAVGADPVTGLHPVRVTNERYRQQSMREIAIEQEMRRA